MVEKHIQMYFHTMHRQACCNRKAFNKCQLNIILKQFLIFILEFTSFHRLWQQILIIEIVQHQLALCIHRPRRMTVIPHSSSGFLLVPLFAPFEGVSSAQFPFRGFHLFVSIFLQAKSFFLPSHQYIQNRIITIQHSFFFFFSLNLQSVRILKQFNGSKTDENHVMYFVDFLDHPQCLTDVSYICCPHLLNLSYMLTTKDLSMKRNKQLLKITLSFLPGFYYCKWLFTLYKKSHAD